ncbi:MAG: hypothetical protein ABSC38_03370 [Verrucomicrobiia bacterium]
MRMKSVWFLCAVMLALVVVGTNGAPAPALPAKAKLVRVSESSNGLVVTKISEKDIIAECATEHGRDPKDLQFMLVAGGFYVVDAVTTNPLCPFLYTGGGCITQVVAGGYSGKTSNTLNIVVLDSVTAPTNGMLEADIGGSSFIQETITIVSNASSKVAVSMAIQVGSHSNNCVYTGTIKASGKMKLIT